MTQASGGSAQEYRSRAEDRRRRATRAASEKAEALYRRALVSDSTYAPALAGLGALYVQRAHNLGLGRTWLNEAITAAEQAIVLDPQLADAHRAVASACTHKGWLRRGLEANRRSYELAPSAMAAQGIGWTLWFTGRADEALPWPSSSGT